jgi:hypothetical protein
VHLHEKEGVSECACVLLKKERERERERAKEERKREGGKGGRSECVAGSHEGIEGEGKRKRQREGLPAYMRVRELVGEFLCINHTKTLTQFAIFYE